MSAIAPRRALVLGGGGVLGAAWTIGALSAVSDSLGWDPRTAEVVVGTSAGAVVAAMLAGGLGVESLVNHQLGIPAPGDPHVDFDPDTASGGSRPPMPRLRIGSTALVARTVRHPRRTPMLAALAGLAPPGRGSLEAVASLVRSVDRGAGWPSAPQTWIVAMDYDGGHRVAFGRDDAPPAEIADAVVASCAIPGWYAPTMIGGRRYVDGGTLSPTSIDLLCDAEVDEALVLAPLASFDYDAPSGVVGRVERRFRRAMTRRVVAEAGRLRARGVQVTVIGPGREDLEAIGVNLMDHRRRHSVLDVARRTTADALASPPSRLSAAG
jgi:NTE family protein